jgi:hypothetical protein
MVLFKKFIPIDFLIVPFSVPSSLTVQIEKFTSDITETFWLYWKSAAIANVADADLTVLARHLQQFSTLRELYERMERWLTLLQSELKQIVCTEMGDGVFDDFFFFFFFPLVLESGD